MVSKAICIVDIVLFLSSIAILSDIEEIASAIVILTCTLINIYIPYSKMKKLYALPATKEESKRQNLIEEALLNGGDLSGIL